MAELTGTGGLADDLYLLAHHEVTGRPHLAPRALGLGLAGALLAELILSGSAWVRPDAVVVTWTAQPHDGLARSVHGLIAAERERHPVRDWLNFLARTAARQVALRLVRCGYLTALTVRFPRNGRRWVPVDADSAFAAVIRVQSALDPSRPASEGSAALAGLAASCGLGPRLLPFGPPNARRCLEDAVRRLRPDLREVIAQTQTCVDSALLSQRV